MSSQSYRERTLVSVIGDDDTVTGMLLAGTGQVNENGDKNFFIITQSKIIC